MTLEEIKTMLESIEGFSGKVAYWAFPEGAAPALPFICFVNPADNSFGADNITYYASKEINVELYTQQRDTATEDLIAAKLTENGIYYEKSVLFITSENCYEVIFEIEV